MFSDLILYLCSCCVTFAGESEKWVSRVGFKQEWVEVRHRHFIMLFMLCCSCSSCCFHTQTSGSSACVVGGLHARLGT